eukprot:5186-Amphidinium_carterae.1
MGLDVRQISMPYKTLLGCSHNVVLFSRQVFWIPVCACHRTLLLQIRSSGHSHQNWFTQKFCLTLDWSYHPPRQSSPNSLYTNAFVD